MGHAIGASRDSGRHHGAVGLGSEAPGPRPQAPAREGDRLPRSWASSRRRSASSARRPGRSASTPSSSPRWAAPSCRSKIRNVDFRAATVVAVSDPEVALGLDLRARAPRRRRSCSLMKRHSHLLDESDLGKLIAHWTRVQAVRDADGRGARVAADHVRLDTPLTKGWIPDRKVLDQLADLVARQLGRSTLAYTTAGRLTLGRLPSTRGSAFRGSRRARRVAFPEQVIWRTQDDSLDAPVCTRSPDLGKGAAPALTGPARAAGARMPRGRRDDGSLRGGGSAWAAAGGPPPATPWHGRVLAVAPISAPRRARAARLQLGEPRARVAVRRRAPVAARRQRARRARPSGRSGSPSA